MRKPLVINKTKWNVGCNNVLVSPNRREGGVMNKLILRSLITASLLLVLLSLPSIASADSVLWTLTGVTFAGLDPTTGLPNGTTGGTANGSFDYNAATNTFSNIDITTTAGSGFGGATYSGLLSNGLVFGSSSTGLLLGAPGTAPTGLMGPVLMLLFDTPLINTGGTVTDTLTTGAVDGGGEGTCDSADCSASTQNRFITGGAATSTVGVVTTPEPSALSLLAVALAALFAGAVIRKASQA